VHGNNDPHYWVHKLKIRQFDASRPERKLRENISNTGTHSGHIEIRVIGCGLGR